MWFNKMPRKNFLYYCTEQLNLLYQSGIPLSQAFHLLAQEKTNTAEAELFKNIEAHINQGQSLYLSLKRYKEIFPKFYLKLIELGEQSGRLQEVLANLAKTLSEELTLKRKVTMALFYPLTVLVINSLMIFALLWFVVPQYASFFAKNQDALPTLTLILMALSNELHHYFWLNIIMLILIAIGIRYALKQYHYQQRIYAIIAKFYLIKPLIKLRDLALLSRNLSLCLQAGLSLTQALNLCGPLGFDPKWQKLTTEVVSDINRGKNLSQALKKHELPSLMLQLIKIGEASGKMEEQLLKIALIYEAELAIKLNRLTQLIEPVMMLVLGASIGLIMYGLYQPLIQLGSVI